MASTLPLTIRLRVLDVVGNAGGMSDSNAELAEVYDHAAAGYDEIIPYFRTFGQRLVELVDVRPGDRVLDVAAGRGACAFPAAVRTGSAGWVHGVDFSVEMVRDLRVHVREQGAANVDVEQMDAQNLSVGTGRYDVVTCGFALFLMPEPDRAAAEFRRALRPGGQCAVSTPAGETDAEWDFLTPLFTRHMAEAGIASPPQADEPFDAASILRDAGFTGVRTVTETATFRFLDPDAWWRWIWTMGWRLALQELPPEARDGLRREATDRLLDLTRDDGLHMSHATTYTLAVSA